MCREREKLETNRKIEIGFLEARVNGKKQTNRAQSTEHTFERSLLLFDVSNVQTSSQE